MLWTVFLRTCVQPEMPGMLLPSLDLMAMPEPDLDFSMGTHMVLSHNFFSSYRAQGEIQVLLTPVLLTC